MLPQQPMELGASYFVDYTSESLGSRAVECAETHCSTIRYRHLCHFVSKTVFGHNAVMPFHYAGTYCPIMAVFVCLVVLCCRPLVMQLVHTPPQPGQPEVTQTNVQGLTKGFLV